ncbi:MAG: hypothetical protein QXP02_03675 [Desulfurococcaceae archaeon]
MQLDIEDRIILTRLLTGLIYGVSVFVLTYFLPPIIVSSIAWSGSILVYYATILYVLFRYRPTKRFHLYLRGLMTFYATWLITSYILYDVFK